MKTLTQQLGQYAAYHRDRRPVRLAKDFEATIESAEAWVFVASIRLLVRRVQRQSQPQVAF